MGIDRCGRNDRRAGTSAWLCLVACAFVGVQDLHARPTALQQLRAAVGLEPAGPRPAEAVATPETFRLVPVPTAPREPTRLDRVERLVDVLAVLNRATPPGSPPFVPVEAVAPERPIVPAVHETPAPNLAPVEGASAPAREVAVAASSGLWERVGAVVCLALIGTFVVAAVFLAARSVGLSIRLRVSLGAPRPRA